MKNLVALVGPLVLILGACGSSSSDGDGDGSNGFLPENPEATISISGNWLIEETDTGNDCEEGDLSDSWNAEISQSGSKVTLETDGESYKGVVDGKTLYWVASYPEDGGTTTSKGKVTWDGETADTMTGNSSWTWKGDGFSCSGKTSILATCHGVDCIVEI